MVFSFTALGSVLMYRFTRTATKDKTIHNSYLMTPKQRKNNGYSLVNPYTRTEPCFRRLSSRSVRLFGGFRRRCCGNTNIEGTLFYFIAEPGLPSK